MEYGILDSAGGTVICKFAAPTKILNNAPAFTSDSVSLKRHAVSQKAQRWEILTNLMPENNSREFFVQNTTRGYTGAFMVRMPQPYGTAQEIRDLNGTTLTVLSSTTAGSSLLTHSNSSTQRWIPAGAFITFGNHTKVYTVLRNMVNGVPLEVFPPLVASVPSGTIINYTHPSVKMVCSYDTDTALGISYTDGILSDPGQVKLVERL